MTSLDRGRRPPSPGNPYRNPAGRAYRGIYLTALFACALTTWRHRDEIGEVWAATVRWARDR